MGKIAITMGDPAGIGVEIILKSLADLNDFSNFILIGSREIFSYNEKICGISLPDNIDFIDIPCNFAEVTLGKESAISGKTAYLCLEKACELVNNGIVDKIATAPLSKNALHLAGYDYSGQTEILQEKLGKNSNKAQMLFVAENLRILLLTRHFALKDIPSQITEKNIIETTRILSDELITKFNISAPKIAMCALNPHGGENGILGDEEINIINPAIKKLNSDGINLSGAYSADTLLGKAVKNYKKPDFDAYIACYHDQALPAIKSLGLDKVLNVTIGLKALRVSPSHGTAFDIAGKNIADYSSMLNAILFCQH